MLNIGRVRVVFGVYLADELCEGCVCGAGCVSGGANTAGNCCVIKLCAVVTAGGVCNLIRGVKGAPDDSTRPVGMSTIC